MEVLNRMMQELLDFTRGMTPSAVLPRVDYADFAREVVFELEPEASRRGIRVDAELGPLASAWRSRLAAVSEKVLTRSAHHTEWAIYDEQ